MQELNELICGFSEMNWPAKLAEAVSCATRPNLDKGNESFKIEAETANCRNGHYKIKDLQRAIDLAG